MVYDHLKHDEREVARLATVKGLCDLSKMSWDVHVGKGFTPPDDWKESTKKSVISLTKKRIDAIEEDYNKIKIFEFTTKISTRTIGNLLMYRSLLKKERPGNKEITLWLVGNEGDEDLEDLIKELNINLRIV